MDSTKQCWSCGKMAMFPKGSYFECIECGATWNELPTLAFTGLVVEPVSHYRRDTKYRLYRRRSRVKAKDS